MTLSRRQVLEAGAAAGTLVALAGSPLLAQVVRPAARPMVPPPAPAPVHARPRVVVDAIVDPRIVERARAAYDRHRWQILHTDYVGIADFTRASRDPRFYIINTTTGHATQHLVSHGRGSDPGHTGYLHYFSNLPGSEASSAGSYLTSSYYYGKYGRSMRVRGLDYSNSNAERRAIVVHTAWYAEPNVAEATGRLGRSEGCFALPHASLREVLDRLGPGRFLYADRLA